MTRYLTCLLAFLMNSTAIAQTANWTQTSGPSGAMIKEIVVSPKNGDLFLIGHGLLRSTDRGSSWTPIPTGLTGEIRDLHVTSKGMILLSLSRSYQATDLAISKDNGITWDTIQNLLNYADTRDVIASTTSGNLYVISGQTVKISTDDGESWSSTDFQTHHRSIWGVDSVLFLGNNRRSTDGGITWAALLNGIPNDSEVEALVSVSPELIIIKKPEHDYESTDMGRTWKASNLYRVGEVMPDEDGNRIIVGGAFRSGSTAYVRKDKTSFTASWPYYAIPEMGNWYKFTSIISTTGAGEFMVASVDGLFELDTSNRSWSERILPISNVPVLVSHPSGSLIAASHEGLQTGSSWHSSNGGASWRRLTFEEPSWNPDPWINPWIRFTAATLDSSYNILACDRASFYRSTNGGTTFEKIANNTAAGFTQLAVASNGYIFGAGNSYRILRSTDAGATWDQMDYGISASGIRSVGVHSNGTLYAGGNAALFKSTDQAKNWAKIGSEFFDTLSNCGDIRTITINNAGALLLGTDSGGVIISTDEGNSFSILNDGLHGTSIRSLVNTPSDKVFAATESGVYFLADTSLAWESVSEGLSNQSCLSLTRDKEGRLYVGTAGNGVSFSTKTYNKTQTNSVSQPSDTRSFAAYPNPSSHVVHLTNMPHGTDVQIFDIYGRLVEIPVVWAELGVATIIVSGLANGSYAIRASNGESRFMVVSH